MKSKEQKFYGNPLIGTWRVPSTSKGIIPLMDDDGKQRMTWRGGGYIDELGNYIPDYVEGIEWKLDGWSREKNEDGKPLTYIYMPWYKGEQLKYDEAM
jgi:hypothetical protein